MTAQYLIELLQQLNPDTEIRIASQPKWPFEYTIDDLREVRLEEGEEVAYIVEGTQIGYLPEEASEELGW